VSLSGGPLDGGDLVRVPPAGGPRRVLGRRDDRADATRSTAIALVSTVVFFGVIGGIVVNAPGWPAVQESFFNGRLFAEAFGFIRGSFVWERSILRAFLVNAQLFLIAEVLILVFGLVLAVLRSLPGPVFFPVRALATVYADVFRALPGVLVIFILGFGIPGLGIAGVPVEPFFYAVVALTLIYSAYVSEVYRAGIESVHPSQEAAARSLGLSRFQSLRFVILPQAVRRVIPPLLNDFIGLQKDTVLVSFVGVVEIFRASQIKQAATFNFTPYVATALVFIVVTIPLARLTDLLVARDRRRAAAGAR
jgi:polar amino acid transport system permease protein